MFIVLFRFSDNKQDAGKLMEKHTKWVKQGFEEDVFLLAGSLLPKAGGGILAYNTSISELQDRVNQDPFVQEKVVSAEIIEIAPSKAHERLDFLIN